MNCDARPTTASPTVSPAVPDWSVATSLLNASNCVFVKPKGAHRVDAGLITAYLSMISLGRAGWLRSALGAQVGDGLLSG